MNKKTVKRRTRKFVRRPMSPAEKKRWNDAADKLLEQAKSTFELSRGFDTAVSRRGK